MQQHVPAIILNAAIAVLAAVAGYALLTSLPLTGGTAPTFLVCLLAFQVITAITIALTLNTRLNR